MCNKIWRTYPDQLLKKNFGAWTDLGVKALEKLIIILRD